MLVNTSAWDTQEGYTSREVEREHKVVEVERELQLAEEELERKLVEVVEEELERKLVEENKLDNVEPVEHKQELDHRLQEEERRLGQVHILEDNCKMVGSTALIGAFFSTFSRLDAIVHSSPLDPQVCRILS